MTATASGAPAPIPVVGVALVRQGTAGTELLAARRIEPPELAGGWELPGGKVEPGESPEQAAHREINEELGVDIVLGEHIPGPLNGAWALGERHQMNVFLASVVAGQEPTALQQHDLIRWLPLADWATVEWLAGDVAPVRAVVELLR